MRNIQDVIEQSPINGICNNVSAIELDQATVHYVDLEFKDQKEKDEPSHIFNKENSFTEEISLKEFAKFIELKLYTSKSKIAPVFKTTLKSEFNINVEDELLNVHLDEFNQQITRSIVSKIAELGEINFKKGLADKWNKDLMMKDQLDDVLKKSKISFWKNPFQWFKNLFRPQVFVVENINPIQSARRIIMSKILILSNYVSMTGKRGSCNTLIVSSRMSALLMDMEAFVPFEMEQNLNGVTTIYKIGKLMNLIVYVDPYMRWNDNRIIAFRKGNSNEPGVGFAYNSKFGFAISEAVDENLNSNLIVGCKYLVFETGFYPEKNYVTAEINIPDDIL